MNLKLNTDYMTNFNLSLINYKKENTSANYQLILIKNKRGQY